MSVIYPSQVICVLELVMIFMLFSSLKCFDFSEKITMYGFTFIAWIIFATQSKELDSQTAFVLSLVGLIYLRI